MERTLPSGNTSDCEELSLNVWRTRNPQPAVMWFFSSLHTHWASTMKFVKKASYVALSSIIMLILSNNFTWYPIVSYIQVQLLVILPHHGWILSPGARMLTVLAGVHSVTWVVKTLFIIGGEKSAMCIMIFDLHRSWSYSQMDSLTLSWFSWHCSTCSSS
jgi:hypothetical protein